MYKFIEPFGLNINANSIGEAWLDLVSAILNNGDKTYDEGRLRLSLQNLRIRIENPETEDEIIRKYGDKEKVDAIIYLTFRGEEMYDFDVVPSFSPGARSYYSRLKEGRMDQYVVKRLSNIPESKKGVISFIHWDDYVSVLDTPYDDYLPCLTTIQFRLIESDEKYDLNVIFNARSIDAFQKVYGNLIAITMLANKIASQIELNVGKKINFRSLDGMITDAHIYNECVVEAKEVLSDYNKNELHNK